MKTSNRRIFLRNTSLTATGIYAFSPLIAKKLQEEKTVISCGPTMAYELLASVATVQSGLWSDPATWGGAVPATTDFPSITNGHSVVIDINVTIAGLLVSSGASLEFTPEKSVTLQSSKNVIIEGKLLMKPSSISNIHVLRFVNVKEAAFVGGGMSVLDTDTGLWVMGAGQLDLAGTPKTSWTRAVGDLTSGSKTLQLESAAGWQQGDEITVVPTESTVNATTFYNGFEERVVAAVQGNSVSINTGLSRNHPMVNALWTAEVMNLTRNVRIEGTTSGATHVFVMSSAVQNVKYISVRYVGPRKDRNNDGVKELVKGRYGLHFHHCDFGTVGSLIEGNVIRDSGSHCYVPHTSHGMKFVDNVSYNTLETAFWWDLGDPTHNTIWDHNLVAKCDYVSRSLDFEAEDAPTFSSSGFAMNSGDGNVCINNVVVGSGLGDYASGGAFNWEAVINEGVWIFKGNLAHNNGCGIRIWQNTTRKHTIEEFIGYHNDVGIFHGAYANNYTYNGGQLFGCKFIVKAASVDSNRVRIQNFIIDGAGIVDNGMELIHSPLPGERPIILINVTIKGCKTNAIEDSVSPEPHCADLINCNIQGNIVITPDAVSTEKISVQPVTGQTYRLTQTGKTNISPIGASFWGTGSGLKGEYFNGLDFTSIAFARIDQNLSFSEWSSGVHHALTSNSYSIRWTGWVQAQFTEAYVFCLSSSGAHRLWINGKLVLENWKDHVLDDFFTAPINMVAGEKVSIKLDYFNTDEKTMVVLSWKSPSMALEEFVPQSQLYPEAITSQPAGNLGPIANAGVDQTISLPQTSVNLDGSASSDPDGTIASYLWTKLSGPTSFSIANSTTSKTAVTGLIAGDYTFRLKVTDNKGASNTDDVLVKVLASALANQVPVANAGPDQTIVLPVNTVNLDGSGSNDPDGNIVSYSWTVVSGPLGAVISAPGAKTTQVSGLVQGTYYFRLKVVDNKGDFSEDDVMIIVKASITINEPPIANAGSDIIVTLPANTAVLNGSLSKDPDGSSLIYEWSKISGPAQGSLSNANASIANLSNLVQGQYIYQLKVTDSKNASSQDQVTVIVNAATPPANKPPIANAGSDISITLPTTAVTLNGAQSADPDGNLTGFEWTQVSGPSQANILFPAAIKTGVTALVAGTYVFRLTVTDNAGSKNTDEVKVTVNSANSSSQVTPLILKVLQNPSNYCFTLKIKSETNFPITVKIFDEHGKLMEKIMNLPNDTTITVGCNLKRGAYWAFAEQGRKKAVVMLIKG